MDCKWLEDFLALSQHGNYSQAAAQRHITQPALSRRIKALEEVLGVPLFDRTTTPVTLMFLGRAALQRDRSEGRGAVPAAAADERATQAPPADSEG